MKRRVVIDLDLPAPPEGDFAGLNPYEYPLGVAVQILGALIAVTTGAAIRVESFTIGVPPDGTRAPNPMLTDRTIYDPETGEVLS